MSAGQGLKVLLTCFDQGADPGGRPSPLLLTLLAGSAPGVNTGGDDSCAKNKKREKQKTLNVTAMRDNERAINCNLRKFLLTQKLMNIYLKIKIRSNEKS